MCVLLKYGLKNPLSKNLGRTWRIVSSLPKEKINIGGDLNGHVGKDRDLKEFVEVRGME